MANDIRGDQRIERNLTVGGYFEIEDEPVVTTPTDGTKVRIHKKIGDNNLYIINSSTAERAFVTMPSGVIISNGSLLIGNGTNFDLNTLTSGNGISITNDSGTISIGSSLIAGSGLVLNGITFDIGTGSGIIVSADTISVDEANIPLTNLAGTLTVGKGGTGLSTTPTNGQLLIGNGTNYTLATLTQGTGIAITNSTGSITISSTGGGSTSGATSSFDIAQTGHGFVVGNVIYHDGSNYVKAKADNALTAEKIGVISVVTDANNCTVLLMGPLTLTTAQWDVVTGQSGGLTTGTDYYLSDTVSGGLTTTEPVISNLVMRSVSSTKAIIKEFESKQTLTSNQIIDEEFTTTNGQTVFTLSFATVSKAYTWLMIDNIPQNDDAYSITSNILTLNSAPGAGIIIKIKYVRSVSFDTASLFIDQEFTAYDGQTTFTLASAPLGKPYTFLSIDNLVQTDDAYTLNGNSLVTTTGISSGIVVKAKYIQTSGSKKQYLSRVTYAIGNGGVQSLGSLTETYEVFDQANAKTYAKVMFTNGDTDPIVQIPAGSAVSNVANTASKLNIYVTGGNLVLQNNLGSDKTFVVYNNGGVVVNSVSTDTAAVTPSQLRGNLMNGFILSNSSGDVTNDIDISAGSCTDSTYTSIMTGQALTKQLDSAWAVGTNAGGRMSPAAITNTTYHVYAIRKDSDQSIDYGFDVSATSPTLPSGYSRFRRIGTIIRKAGAILLFTQKGDYFDLVDEPTDLSAVNPGTTGVTVTSMLALNCIARFNVSTEAGTAGTNFWVSTAIDQTSKNPGYQQSTESSTQFQSAQMYQLSGNRDSAQIFVRLNSFGQWRYKFNQSDGNTTIAASLAGWVDDRGRFN